MRTLLSIEVVEVANGVLLTMKSENLGGSAPSSGDPMGRAFPLSHGPTYHPAIEKAVKTIPAIVKDHLDRVAVHYAGKALNQ